MKTLFTIGHSTHPMEEFLQLLRQHGIAELVDIRSIPKSRHCPQFNAEALQASLHQGGFGYACIKNLGGRRYSRKTYTNLGWRNASFRGYADYMTTPGFAEGLTALIQIAETHPTAIMCAEAVPWRCHRSLVADALTVQGWQVLDIFDAGPAKPHRLTPFLKVVDGQLTYPACE